MGTPDKVRAKNYRDRKKQREAEAKVESINACGTREAWYEKNRAELAERDPEKLAQLQARNSQVLDVIHWMENVDGDDPSDPDYVSLADGIDILVDDIRTHGCPHLGYIMRDQEIPSDWSTGAWHDGKKYWQDADLLRMLQDEGPATSNYITYGFLSGPPDWKVVEFLTSHGWSWADAATLVGYVIPTADKSRDAVVAYR